MIALPFRPSNVYTIEELNANLEEILRLMREKGTQEALLARLDREGTFRSSAERREASPRRNRR